MLSLTVTETSSSAFNEDPFYIINLNSELMNWIRKVAGKTKGLFKEHGELVSVETGASVKREMTNAIYRLVVLLIFAFGSFFSLF